MSENIWVEKYRPKSLSEVVGHTKTIGRLTKLAENIKLGKATLPHLLLSGPGGVGKTSAVKAFVNDIYGDISGYKMLELNASDERGIDVIRDKVKNFCRTAPWENALNIVFLDEADGLTEKAQQALRRTMERYSRTTRFFLACNYITKIIDPIRGRCAILHFYPLSTFEVKSQLKNISLAEEVKVSLSALEFIAQRCKGDMRASINALQFLAMSQDSEITEKDIYEYGWKIDLVEVDELIRLCYMTKAIKNEDDLNVRLQEIDRKLQKFYEHGASDQNFVEALYLSVMALKLKPRNKAGLIERMGELDYRITVGSNPYIQIRAFLYGILYSRVRWE